MYSKLYRKLFSRKAQVVRITSCNIHLQCRFCTLTKENKSCAHSTAPNGKNTSNEDEASGCVGKCTVERVRHSSELRA